ncbi:STAS domain-containing protein [Flavobacterium sp. JLP]|uniref:STAS domain-containing protein n=1 Tax=unclassified Flavobacterium TaxID=196869 RepID=UPI00188CBA38|nr:MULTISPECIES: STAS domain-containing protein [unclassified Flavobacterium]MBF4494188.1 STAS domain-containing protein [Flavobacterium sp. MR2016-29]MBF4507715.1 STAS domain-containing protein [Flavobacterium sp. JLP]
MQKNVLGALKEHENKLLTIWSQLLLENGSTDGATEEEESKEFASLLLDALHQSKDNQNSEEFEKVHDLLIGISSSRAKRGFSPRENAQYLISFKEAASKILSDIEKDPVELYNANLQLGSVLDNMTIMTFEAYMKGREDVISRQIDEISEISTPVIRVWDGVVALPIIGTLDSSRTQVVMENLLQQIVDTGSSIAILDISGVPAVDSLVAQHLIKTVSATRLMGAECIISGIRPEIAQTVVHLGIDLTGIITKASLASALQTAFEMLQLTVVKRK